MPSCNSCQLVLKYMLMNKNTFIKAYHNRLYAFSSGSKFDEVMGPLSKWLEKHQALRDKWSADNATSNQSNPHFNPRRALKRIENINGLYDILGNVLIDFMEVKPTPFLTNALASKDDFWNVPAWKRAMTFVFLVRYVLGYVSQGQWKKFTEQDLKINTRCFRRWKLKDEEIFNNCTKFQDMPDRPSPRRLKTVPKKSKRTGASLSSDSPVKRCYVVGDDSTDDD